MTQAEQVKAVRSKYPCLTRMACRMMFGEMTFWNRTQLLLLAKDVLERKEGSDDVVAQSLYSDYAKHMHGVLTGKIKTRKGERIPKSHNLE